MKERVNLMIKGMRSPRSLQTLADTETRRTKVFILCSAIGIMVVSLIFASLYLARFNSVLAI